jgi:hypothetical protein
MAWLNWFKDYEGDECFVFPFRTVAQPRGSVLFGATRMTATIAMCRLAHKVPDDLNKMALHTCGNGHEGCVNPNHLYWGTVKDNAADAAEHRRFGKPVIAPKSAGDLLSVPS